MRRTLVMALLATGALGLPGVARADDWVVTSTKEGITYARRAVEGSAFFEYSAETRVAAPPERVVEAVWLGITQSLPSTIKKREVLRRSADEIVVYDQIRTPVVSDRDVTIRIRKRAMPAAFEVRFETANAEGPPESKGYVRMPVVRGAWSVTRTSDGATVLRYQCYSEPGGSVPAWMVRGAQQDQIAMDVRRMLQRLK